MQALKTQMSDPGEALSTKLESGRVGLQSLVGTSLLAQPGPCRARKLSALLPSLPSSRPWVLSSQPLDTSPCLACLSSHHKPQPVESPPVLKYPEVPLAPTSKNACDPHNISQPLLTYWVPDDVLWRSYGWVLIPVYVWV